MTSLPSAPGVRVVRPLARGGGVERLLVHGSGAEGTAPAVLLRALDARGAVRVRRELIALERGCGAGVVRVLDVVADREAPALVLERLSGERLGRLLLSPPTRTAGEVVAILAPLVECVRRLHGSGLAHGQLTANAVLQTWEGPVLTSFPAAALFARGAPEAQLAMIPEVAADREFLRAIALDLLARVDGARAAAARELLLRLAGVPGSEVCDELLEGLGELAAPVPVRLHEGEEPPREGRWDEQEHHGGSVFAGLTPARPGHAPSASADPVSPPAAPARGESKSDWSRAILGDGSVREWIERSISSLQSWSARLPTLRRRLILAGAVAIPLATLLGLLLPGESSERSPVPGPSPSQSHPAPEPSASRVADLDDPAAAVVLLLERRERCFHELSLLCLEEVDATGSAALANDRTALHALREGGELDGAPRPPIPAAEDVRIVERLGDAVLVEFEAQTAPASLLLMRSEAGWRIRDWVAVS